MKVESTVSTTVKTSVRIELEDAEIVERWPGWTHTGKRVVPKRMSFAITDGEPGRLRIEGVVVKKDGTEGSQFTEYELWNGYRSMVGWVSEEWPGEREVKDEILRPLVEVAREELREVMG